MFYTEVDFLCFYDITEYVVVTVINKLTFLLIRFIEYISRYYVQLTTFHKIRNLRTNKLCTNMFINTIFQVLYLQACAISI